MNISSAAPGYSREQRRLYRRLVRPYFLRMALVEAPTEVDPRASLRFRRKLVRAGSRVTFDEVVLMLRGGGWREMTMGAWFALAVPADEVRAAVLEAWSTVGRDAVGPLTTVSALVVGPDAITAMRSFVASADGYDDPGTAEYVSAAIAYLGGGRPSDPEIVASFEESLSIATALRSDFLARRRGRRAGRGRYVVGTGPTNSDGRPETSGP